MTDTALQSLHKTALDHLVANRFKDAQPLYHQILQQTPNDFIALQNYSTLACATGQNELAVDLLTRAIALDPNKPALYNNLGAILALLRRFDDAIAVLQRAVATFPDDVHLKCNLGRALTDAGRAAEAFPYCQAYVQHAPNDPDAHINLSLAYLAQGDFAQSIAINRRALTLVPNHSKAHTNLAMSLLLTEQFEEGWQEFEWIATALGVRPDLFLPPWNGQPVPGRSIIVYSEQGFGDTIHFIRYLPLLAPLCGRIILRCQRELIPLLKKAPGVHDIMAYEDTLPLFDYHCRLLSLPRLFKTNLSNIPAKVPYLTADPARLAHWATRLKPGNSLKVGLAWAGNPDHLNDRNRSLPLAAFAALSKIPNLTLYSLQKGPAAAQAATPPAGLNIIDLTPDLRDFADTAALIATLDLVICADTVIAHLAGALGKPTFTLIPFIPDWRWLLHRPDTPWYPTMKLFRQPTHGDWTTPLAQLTTELASRTSAIS